METQTGKAGFTIDVDIPCSQCEYNLRGLEAGGRCPECGGAIGRSLIRAIDRTGELDPLRRADLKWLRCTVRGLYLLVLGSAIWTACVFLPELDVRPRWVRPVALGVCCTTWVFTWLGMMRISAIEPKLQRIQGERAWRWVLRIAGTGYFLYPFLEWGEPYADTWGRRLDLYPGFVVPAAMLAAISLHQTFRLIAIRLPSRMLPVQFYLLSISCGCMGLAIPWSRYSMGPFEFMLQFPSPALGLPMLLGVVATRWYNLGEAILIGLLALLVLWAWVTLIWLTFAVRREYRAARALVSPDFR